MSFWKKLSWKNLERGVKRAKKKFLGKSFYRNARRMLKGSLMDLLSETAGISEENLEMYWDKAQTLVRYAKVSQQMNSEQKRAFVKEKLIEYGTAQGLKLLGNSDLNLLIEQVYAKVSRFDF